jgi:hypothetical protein
MFLKMGAAVAYETSVTTSQTAEGHNPEEKI